MYAVVAVAVAVDAWVSVVCRCCCCCYTSYARLLLAYLADFDGMMRRLRHLIGFPLNHLAWYEARHYLSSSLRKIENLALPSGLHYFLNDSEASSSVVACLGLSSNTKLNPCSSTVVVVVVGVHNEIVVVAAAAAAFVLDEVLIVVAYFGLLESSLDGPKNCAVVAVLVVVAVVVVAS